MPIRFEIKTSQDKLQSISTSVMLGEGDIAVASAENFAIVMQDIPSGAKEVGEVLDPTEVEKTYQEMQEHSVTVAFKNADAMKIVMRMICSSYLSHLGLDFSAHKEIVRKYISQYVSDMLSDLREEVTIICKEDSI